MESSWKNVTADPFPNSRAIRGCILGTAVGDALGLPFEGLSPRRSKRLFKEIDQHHFLFGRGMISDDTEHTLLVARSMIEAGGDPERFLRLFAGKLKTWLLCMPAGIGFATLRALLKLCVGYSPDKSGVWSAGNGPAMRTPICGVAYGNEPEKLVRFVRLSTGVTHTDPKAFHGALAVALAAHMSATSPKIGGREFLERLETLFGGQAADELLNLIEQSIASVEHGETTQAFARSLNLEKGVTGYMFHTVPVVIHAWLKNPNDFRTAIVDIIACGGDADTTAAILGGIIGARGGIEGIPKEWIDGIAEWPMTVPRMIRIADSLHASLSGSPEKPVSSLWPLVLIRNLLFAAIVILHGIRRIFPPY